MFLQATIAIGLTSCSMRVPLSSASIEEYDLSAEDLKQLHYFPSEDIVLYRINEANDPVAYKGNLFRTQDTAPAKTFLKASTSGIAKKVMDDRVVLSFDIGPSRNLVFGTDKSKGLYELMAKRWIDGHGMLDYGDREYYSLPGSSDTFVYFCLLYTSPSPRDA